MRNCDYEDCYQQSMAWNKQGSYCGQHWSMVKGYYKHLPFQKLVMVNGNYMVKGRRLL